MAECRGVIDTRRSGRSRRSWWSTLLRDQPRRAEGQRFSL